MKELGYVEGRNLTVNRAFVADAPARFRRGRHCWPDSLWRRPDHLAGTWSRLRSSGSCGGGWDTASS